MNICKQLYCDKPVATITKTYGKQTKEYTLKTCLEHKKIDNLPIGSKKIANTGYMIIKTENGWIPEHTIVMREKLGRPLMAGESVHHVNGMKHDNRPENLELWIGNIRYAQRATDIKCPKCGISYWDAVTS